MSTKRWPLQVKTRQGMGFEAGLMSPGAGGNQASDGGQAADPQMLMRGGPGSGPHASGTLSKEEHDKQFTASYSKTMDALNAKKDSGLSNDPKAGGRDRVKAYHDIMQPSEKELTADNAQKEGALSAWSAHHSALSPRSMRSSEDQERAPDGKFGSGTLHDPHESKTAKAAAGQNTTKFKIGDEVKNKFGDSGKVLNVEGNVLKVNTGEGKTQLWMSGHTEPREKTMNVEIRYASKMTVEERGDQGDEMALVGYAAAYNSLSKPLPEGFVEKIAPGAFDRALAEKQDCRCLFNHDPSRVLGRVSSGTLKLSSDDKGLKFRCALDPNQQAHRDLHAAVKRGDISDCSFAFSPNGEDGHDFDDVRQQDGSWLMIRTLKDVNLYDVSAVTHPAYNDTSVSARDAQMTPEIRSIVTKLLEKRAQTEKRDAFDCLEDYIGAISKAMAEKFPCEPVEGDGGTCCSSYGKFYILETHVDHVIACNTYGPDPQEFVSIPYVISPDGDGFVFGTPVPMEKEYVPAERTAQKVAEHRAMHSGHMQAIADQHAAAAAEHNAMSDAHAAASTEHSAHAAAHQEVADDAAKEAERMKKCEDSDGDCAVKGCRCQNCRCDDCDVWDDEDIDGENQDDRSKRMLAKYGAEKRDAAGKTLTKKVGGKNLPASAFASVGDPNDTSTWKLPVHDKAHADNAAARLDQTADIDKDAAKAKIEAAQKKFGEKTDTRSIDPNTLPMSAEEVEDTMNRLRLITIDSEVRSITVSAPEERGGPGSGPRPGGNKGNKETEKGEIATNNEQHAAAATAHDTEAEKTTGKESEAHSKAANAHWKAAGKMGVASTKDSAEASAQARIASLKANGKI